MSYVAPIEKFPGKIREVTIGSGGNQVKVGGENTLPLHKWEGEIPNKPVIAIEVLDVAPTGWPETVFSHYSDVVNDPAAWAKRAQEFGADLIALSLVGADPNGEDKTPEEAAQAVKAVIDATDLPLIIQGCGNAEKDQEVLKKAAEVAQDRAALIGPALQENYKSVGGAALGYRHNVISSTPIDVNLAKQLNILLSNLGVPDNMVVMDASTGGQSLGYGLEYSYSVMERDRLAALSQNDVVMQVPIICNIAREVWKAKEAKAGEDEQPGWGDLEKRGILWEAITAMSMLVAGANILVMRHPKSIDLARKAIDDLVG